MKNYFLYVFISLFLFSLSSCKDDKDVVAVLELGLENADFYKEVGSVVIDVKSLPADWTASVDVEGEQWCKTEPVNSGAGVKISVISNPNKTVRNASVVINNGKLNKKILVRQLGTDTDILVSPFAFTLPPVGGTVAFTVTTNLTEAELDVTYPSWIKKEVDTRVATIEIPYKFTVDTHEGSSVRTEKIVIKDKNSNISAEVTVIQNGLDGYTFGDTEGIADDVQLEVVRGEASTAHGGEGIEKSFDSDMSTIYHSNYPFAEGVTSHYPVMLTYYFKENTEVESRLRADITRLWEAIDWTWFRKNGEDVLYWHWSPDYGFEKNLAIRGWNECLITYILAASSPTHAIDKVVYEAGWAKNGGIRNGKSYYGITLPLGSDKGGPLFLSQYSFLGINPQGLEDQYADYWMQNRNHTLINYNYCKENPKGYTGYSASCWGLTASDGDTGYSAHSPINDKGVIAPTAALSAFPYTPEESMEALHFFYYKMGDKLWKDYGFIDAFNLTADWYDTQYIAIDQGPIICMIENYRTGLLWNLFMSIPEIQQGLKKLGFQSPCLN